jgi:hypothetical protein
MLNISYYKANQVFKDLLHEIHTLLLQTALSVIKKPWSLLLIKEIT